MAKKGVPLHVLNQRRIYLESLIARRAHLGDVPGKIPLHVLEKRLHRLKAAILAKT